MNWPDFHIGVAATLLGEAVIWALYSIIRDELRTWHLRQHAGDKFLTSGWPPMPRDLPAPPPPPPPPDKNPGSSGPRQSLNKGYR